MKALSIERSICEGEREVKELFEFVTKQAGDLTAYQMEQHIFTKVMHIGLAAMKGYFAAKGTGDVGETLPLPDGRRARRADALCGRDYFSVFGKFKVPRTVYRAFARPGVMPLDAQADLPERCYSYVLQEWMDHVSIRESFQEAEGTLATLLGVQVSASRYEVVNRASITHEGYEQFYDEKPLPSPDEEGAIQVLSFDGKGVPVIKREAADLKARLGKGEKRQNTKEALVGVSYTVEAHVRSADEVATRLVYPEKTPQPPKTGPQARAIRRLASLEQPKQEVVQEIVRDAMRRDPAHRRPWVVVMDGALSLWAVVASVLTGVEWVGVLDIIHVLEYLWPVGTALYGEGTERAQTWVYDRLVALLQGRVGRVIGGLKQTRSKRPLTASQRKAVTQAIIYFEHHRAWMQYDVYLAAGYPIGSGVVESTCGHTVKDRMEGSGRRWSITGAESTLLLRSIVTSHDWEAYWESHMHQEHLRLYGSFVEALPIAEAYHEPPIAQVVGG
jgi:hypothetical protein